MKTAKQRLLELEQENWLLKKQKLALEKELSNSDTKKLQSQVITSFSKENEISIGKTYELLGITIQACYRSL